MTREDREEAIEIIKSKCYVFNPLDLDMSTKINTALDMAVKALGEEPCVDAVSRAEAKKLAWDLELETCYDNEKVVEMLDELPSVTPACNREEDARPDRET